MMMNLGDPEDEDDDRPYYYVLDRMFNVRFLVDRAGAIVERYCYDAYGRPKIRESAGRGDFDGDSDIDSTDATRFNAVYWLGTKWDPRADLDDDLDVDATDSSLFTAEQAAWFPAVSPTVAQAYSDVGNPYLFQGVPHFALDTPASATAAVLPLNQHRMRFNDPVTGRWTTRDPIGCLGGINPYEFAASNSLYHLDPSGKMPASCWLCIGVVAAEAGGAAAGCASGCMQYAGDDGYSKGQCFVDCVWEYLKDRMDHSRAYNVYKTIVQTTVCAACGIDVFAPPDDDPPPTPPDTGPGPKRPRVDKLEPHPEAEGPHTSFRRDDSGRVDKYTEFDEHGNPCKRFRGTGGPHGGQNPPIIYDPERGKGPGSTPKRARPPRPDELPPGY